MHLIPCAPVPLRLVVPSPHAGHVRVADFGLAKTDIVDNVSASTFCGTPEYLGQWLVEAWIATLYSAFKYYVKLVSIDHESVIL